ncbi:MAG: hypothetical protein ACOCQW_05315 [Halanaerobiaceae bacterium]
MGAFFLVIGFLVGKQLSRKREIKSNDTEHPKQEKINNLPDHPKDNKKQKKRNKTFKFKKKMRKTFFVNNNTGQPIDPDKISIDIKKKGKEKNKSSPQASFIALTVLWAHYIAYQFDILKENAPAPWELAFNNEDGDLLEIKKNLNLSPDSWKKFLSNIIKDTSWTSWIKEADEVKNRTLLAFEN